MSEIFIYLAGQGIIFFDSILLFISSSSWSSQHLNQMSMLPGYIPHKYRLPQDSNILFLSLRLVFLPSLCHLLEKVNDGLSYILLFLLTMLADLFTLTFFAYFLRFLGSKICTQITITEIRTRESHEL